MGAMWMAVYSKLQLLEGNICHMKWVCLETSFYPTSTLIILFPHVFVADEAFPLLPILMRPYPKSHPNTLLREESIFNYRLSHARIVVENTFGIFTERWRIFDRAIPLEDNNVDKIVQACVCLHNYLVENKPIAQLYAELNPKQRPFMHGNGIMRRIPRLPGYRSANDAQEIRQIYRLLQQSTGFSVMATM